MNKTISNIDLKNDFKLISEIRNIVITEYRTTIKSVQPTSEKAELGTSLLILKSIFNHFTSLELLLEKCYTESSGSVAASIWEKSITLQYLLGEPTTRFKVYMEHDTFKKFPWKIKDMVIDIVKSERKRKNIEDHIDLQYLQYSYLCAIKHGSPFTLSYLNSLTDKEDFFEPKPTINIENKDIIGLIYYSSIIIFFETIRDFAKKFTTTAQYQKLKSIDTGITNKLKNLDLKVPLIIKISQKDFRKDFWELLSKL